MEEKVGFGYYITIPTKIVEDHDLSPYAKLAFGVIANLSNSRGYCFATNKYLAKLLNLHENTVSRFVNELTNRGYLLRFDELVNDQMQRRLFINAEVAGYIQGNNRGKPEEVGGVNRAIEHNNIIRITNKNKNIEWFREQFDELFIEKMKMLHKDKDIDRGIEEAFIYLSSDENRLRVSEGTECKRLLNTWLSNMKKKKKAGVRMSDEEFLKDI